MVRLGIIGRNFVVDWMLEAARVVPALKPVAIYSRRRETGAAFAQKYGLPVKKVIENRNGETVLPFCEDGICVNSLQFDGRFGEGARTEIANYLIRNAPVADPYMCLADFESYTKTQKKVSELYRTDPMAWNKKSLMNIAASGYFSADRSIRDYANNIWNLKQLNK